MPGLLVYRYDAPLCFANAEDFRSRALAAVEQAPSPPHWLLLDAEAILGLDSTAAEALRSVHDELTRQGVVLAMARVKQELRRDLVAAGLLDRIGEERVFMTLPTAVADYRRRWPVSDETRTTSNTREREMTTTLEAARASRPSDLARAASFGVADVPNRRSRRGGTATEWSTQGLLDRLALCARPAVRGYSDEVVRRARMLGLTVLKDASPGPGRIALVLPQPARGWSIGWRMDSGWFATPIDTSASPVERVIYRADVNPPDRLLPVPAQVAAWLLGLATRAPLPPEIADAAPAVDGTQAELLLARLHTYFPAPADFYRCWTHRPLAPLRTPRQRSPEAPAPGHRPTGAFGPVRGSRPALSGDPAQRES